MIKVGDRVRCIDGTALRRGHPKALRTGEIYTITKICSEFFYFGDERGWFKSRFELVKDEPTMPFDPTKPVQTIGGQPARIVCTDRKHDELPILALVKDSSGSEQAYFYHKNGACCASLPQLTLINVPEEQWVALYTNRHGHSWAGHVHATSDKARAETSGRGTEVGFKIMKLVEA
jgi:hypothetical protein